MRPNARVTRLEQKLPRPPRDVVIPVSYRNGLTGEVFHGTGEISYQAGAGRITVIGLGERGPQTKPPAQAG